MGGRATRTPRRAARSVIRAGVLGLLALPAGSALAQPALTPISAQPYTFAPVCPSEGTDGEVSLAVDRRSGAMVAAWMQDVEGLGVPALRSQLVVSSFSRDGSSWTPAAAPPGVMLCDIPPGVNDDALDPSVSVGPDGRWYLARIGQLAVPGNPVPPPGGVYVATSTNGTRWSWPTLPLLDDYQDDFDVVVADPRSAGRAYVAWTNYPPTPTAEQDQILISRTTDGGATFSLPTPVHRAPSGKLDVLSRPVVLSDGSLLVAFVQIPASTATGNGPFAMYATRSRNHGRSWSLPVLISTGTYADVVDPKTRTVYEPHCCVYSLAAGPDRTAHLAWTTSSSTTAGAVHVVSTFDAGRSWSASVVLDRPAQALEATVAATRTTLAVTWYDFSGDQPAGQVRPTTLWVARSGDGGTTWTIERLAGPFDIASAPPVGAGYLGDFQSLVPVRGGFQAAFTVARPLAVVGPSDVFRAFIPDLPPSSP